MKGLLERSERDSSSSLAGSEGFQSLCEESLKGGGDSIPSINRDQVDRKTRCKHCVTRGRKVIDIAKNDKKAENVCSIAVVEVRSTCKKSAVVPPVTFFLVR